MRGRLQSVVGGRTAVNKFLNLCLPTSHQEILRAQNILLGTKFDAFDRWRNFTHRGHMKYAVDTLHRTLANIRHGDVSLQEFRPLWHPLASALGHIVEHSNPMP